MDFFNIDFGNDSNFSSDYSPEDILSPEAAPGSLSDIESLLSLFDNPDPVLSNPNLDLPEMDLPEMDLPEMDLSEMGLPETGLPDMGLPETGLPETGLPEMGLPEMGLPEMGLPEMDLSETGLSETGLSEMDLSETDLPEMGLPEMGLPETGLSEMDLSETDLPEMGLPEMGLPETDLSETDFESIESSARDAAYTDQTNSDAMDTDAYPEPVLESGMEPEPLFPTGFEPQVLGEDLIDESILPKWEDVTDFFHDLYDYSMDFINGMTPAESSYVPQDAFTEGGTHDSINNVTVIGNVQDDIQYIQPQTNNSCSLMAQEQFVHRYTHTPIPEDVLERFGERWGVYNPDQGTNYEGQTNVLDMFNIPYERDNSANLSDLEDALKSDHDCIVGVDARLFYNDPTIPYGSGHAVAVVGMGQNPETGEMAGFYVTDSNCPNGAHFISASQFDNAWLNDLISIPNPEGVA